MKILFLITAFCALFSFSASAQSGQIYDDLSLTSEILKGERKYAIYLPPGYSESERSYPVLYLLHGIGDDQHGWVQLGEVHRIADKAITSCEATAMIIVMPDASAVRRGFFNDISGEWRYEDFFFEELIPFIEKTYRAKSEKQFRAVAGLGTGGGASFIYAMHRPEFFASSCPLTSHIGPKSIEEVRESLSGKEEKYSESIIQEYFTQHNVLSLIKDLPLEKLKSVRWFIDCADDDFLYESHSLIHIAMRKKEIPHEFRIRDGSHNWTYWRESLPLVLGFISEGFHR